jgi:hypothetical protein
MDKYAISPTDPWTWQLARHEDVEDILDLVHQNYEHEIDQILIPSRPRMCYHLHKSILQQTFETYQTLISVARSKTTDKLVAWSWLERGKYTVYAYEEMATAEFIHVDLNLGTKSKVKLVGQVLEQWIKFCEKTGIPVLTSSSIRSDQTAFMRLHEQYGFVVRGSIAYRKII